jgi:hypothetical protein
VVHVNVISDAISTANRRCLLCSTQLQSAMQAEGLKGSISCSQRTTVYRVCEPAGHAVAPVLCLCISSGLMWPWFSCASTTHSVAYAAHQQWSVAAVLAGRTAHIVSMCLSLVHISRALGVMQLPQGHDAAAANTQYAVDGTCELLTNSSNDCWKSCRGSIHFCASDMISCQWPGVLLWVRPWISC